MLDAARLTVEELKIEIAIHLYATNRIGFGKARELAALSHIQFRHLLAARRDEMIVASNTSPITDLVAIGRLDLLPQLWGEIHIAAHRYRRRHSSKSSSGAPGRGGQLRVNGWSASTSRQSRQPVTSSGIVQEARKRQGRCSITQQVTCSSSALLSS